MPTWAYFFEHPTADPGRNRVVIERAGQRTALVPVDAAGDAPDVAKRLQADDNVELVELCGGCPSPSPPSSRLPSTVPFRLATSRSLSTRSRRRAPTWLRLRCRRTVPAAAPVDMPSVDLNIELNDLIRRYEEAFNANDARAMNDLFSDDCVVAPRSRRDSALGGEHPGRPDTELVAHELVPRQRTVRRLRRAHSAPDASGRESSHQATWAR